MFNEEVKQKLKTLGESKGFECKDEFRVWIGNRYSSIDHVWLKEIPYPKPPPKDRKKIVIVAFEITKDLNNLWNSKKMKGDLINLRLSNASLGVLIIPSMETLRKQAEKRKGEKWLEGLQQYLESLIAIAKPMEVEVWFYDDVRKELNSYK
ncbi:MAG: hypothetical protein ACUVUF_08710 [Candidatus Bathycorpusculaceae bacterium]